jgi:hypothetical protein
MCVNEVLRLKRVALFVSGLIELSSAAHESVLPMGDAQATGAPLGICN